MQSQSEIWNVAAPIIRQEFLEVLESSKKPNEFKRSVVFTEMEERFIRCGLARLYRRRSLPYGSVEEWETARQLRELARGSLLDVPGVDELAERYSHLAGGYYTLVSLKEMDRDKMIVKRGLLNRY